MPLTKLNQDLRRDLKQAVALLKWSGVDLLQAAQKLTEAGQVEEAEELLRIALSFQETEDRLAGYADEVKAGVITRAKVE